MLAPSPRQMSWVFFFSSCCDALTLLLLRRSPFSVPLFLLMLTVISGKHSFSVIALSFRLFEPTLVSMIFSAAKVRRAV
jgi:hypothetical protein